MLDRPSTRRLAPPAQDEVEARIPNRNPLQALMTQSSRS
jgi:hypothetical protein